MVLLKEALTKVRKLEELTNEERDTLFVYAPMLAHCERCAEVRKLARATWRWVKAKAMAWRTVFHFRPHLLP